MAFNQYTAQHQAAGETSANSGASAAPNMFKFQDVSPEMLNYGLSAGQDMLNRQKDRWMPGVSGFWNTLKVYFGVNNTYVVAKLLNVLYPIQNKDWHRKAADESVTEGDVAVRKWELPKHDVNAPDLYIPAMSFITYVLLYGLCQGLGVATRDSFSPDIIIQTIWKCLIVQVCDSCIIKFGLSLLSFTIPFLDAFSYSGYKYIGLCVSVFARPFGSTFIYLSAIYTSIMFGYFIMKTLAAVVPKTPGSPSSPPRHIIIVGFALLQLVISLFLNWM